MFGSRAPVGMPLSGEAALGEDGPDWLPEMLISYCYIHGYIDVLFGKRRPCSCIKWTSKLISGWDSPQDPQIIHKRGAFCIF